MSKLFEITRAWLRQTAKFEGAVTAQVLEHLLERMDALDALEARDAEDANCWASVRQSIHRLRERIEVLEQRSVPGFVELAAPTPEAAPVATDEELSDRWANAAKVAILNRRDYDKALTPADVLKAQIRDLYNLGRQHGPAQPPAAQPAPPAADCSALDARAWAYIGKQATCGDPAATALIDLLNKPSAPQPAPVAAPGIFPVEYADADGDGIRILMEPAEETGQVCWVVRNSRRVNPLLEFPTPEAALVAHRAAQPPAAQPTPPAAPAEGLVERVTNVLGHYGDGAARAVIREVAAWMRQRTGTIANGSQWADMLQQEADQ